MPVSSQDMRVSPEDQLARDQKAKMLVSSELSEDPTNPYLQKEMALRFKNVEDLPIEDKTPKQQSFSEVLKNPKFASLSSAAKKVVFDKYSKTDEKYLSLSPEAQQAVMSKYLPQQKEGFKPLRIAQEVGAALVNATVRSDLENKFEQRFGDVPSGYKVATDEEFFANRKTNPIKDPNNPLYYLVKKTEGKGFIEGTKEGLSEIAKNPGKAAIELGKSLAEDPWMLGLPMVGRMGALAKAEKLATKVGAGAKGTAAINTVAGVTNAGVNIGGVTAAIEGAKQLGEGEFKPGEIGSAVAMSAPFALLGARIKDLKGMISSGKTTPKQAAQDVTAWLESQGVKADNPVVAEAVQAVGYETAPLIKKGSSKEAGEGRLPETISINEKSRGGVYTPETTVNVKAPDWKVDGTPNEMAIQAKVAEDMAQWRQEGEKPFKANPILEPEGITPTRDVQQQLARDFGKWKQQSKPGEPIPPHLKEAADSIGFGQEGKVDPLLLKVLGVSSGSAVGAIVMGGENPGDRLWGAVGGGLSIYALSRIPGMRQRAAVKSVDALELQVAEGMLKGKTQTQVFQELAKDSPAVIQAAKKGSEYLGKDPELPKTVEEAKATKDYYNSRRIQTDIPMKTESLVGVLSTRIKNESKDIFRRTRMYENKILTRPYELMSVTDSFKEVLKKLPDQELAASELFSGDFAAFKAKLTPEQVPAFTNTLKVIETLGDELVAKGIITSKLPDYWPRIITDLEGLLAQYGKQVKVGLQVVLDDANRKSIKSNARPLSPVEEGMVIDKYLRGYPVIGGKPGFAKQRKISSVTPEMTKYYEHPIETLHTYINNAVISSEKASLFGRDVKYLDIDGIKTLDVENSIGSLLQRDLKEGKITSSQIPLLKELLSARYGIGEKAPPRVLQHIRNLTSLALLSSGVSSIRQLSEIGTSFKINGFKPTLEAVYQKLTGRQEVAAKEWGLVNKISEEFSGDLWSGKMLNKAFGISLFSAADIGMKDVFLNAALKRAKTPKGQEQVVSKYKEMLSQPELSTLLSDLKNNKKGDLVHEYLFNELNDIQPLTKLETTQFNLENPKLRVLYTLKSYMIKQGDWIRNNAYQEIKNGDRAKGLKTLAAYMAIIGGSQLTMNNATDWALGREVNWDAADIPLSVFKMFGLNDYNIKKIKDGKIVEVASNIVLPPLKAAQDIADLDKKTVKYIPLMRPLYEHGMGGKEDAAKKQKSKERKLNKTPLEKAVEKRKKELRNLKEAGSL